MRTTYELINNFRHNVINSTYELITLSIKQHNCKILGLVIAAKHANT